VKASLLFVWFGAVASFVSAGCGGTALDLDGDSGGSPFKRPDTGSLPDVGRDAAPPGDASTDITTILPDAPPPFDSGPPPTGLVTVPLGGCVPEYSASVQIGSQTFQLVLDTGSTTLGVASTACTDCSGVTPLYAPGATATDEHQTAMSEYESGNTWQGEIYEDTVGVGTPSATAPVKLVGIDSQMQFFGPFQCGSSETTAAYEGIIGFAPAGAAVGGTNGYFDDLVGKGFAPNLFATQLCDVGGTLWLGGYDPTAVTGPVQFVPMSTSFYSAYAYLVNLASVTVDSTTVTVATGEYTDSIVDTGTSVFILQTDAFNSLTAAITSDPTFQSIVSSSSTWFNSNDNCVSLSQTKAELDAMLPPLTLTYGSSPAVSVTAVATESYLMNIEGYYCPSLVSQATGPEFPFAGILGSPVLKSSVTVFDRAGGRIGFAPHAACSP
jgi:hypothetical protein